jgi:hypothetical protein
MARRRLIDYAREREGRNGHARRQPADGYPPGQRMDADDSPPPESPEAERGPPPKVNVLTAPELLAVVYPEPRWAVPGILPEGLGLLAGKPKLGKSWLAMNVALAVATGGRALGRMDVEAGDVLYLALEDGPRRLQARIRKLLERQQTPPSARLHLACDWPKDKGGRYALACWLQTHPDARLVVIDTWPKFRPRRCARQDEYEQDYEDAGGLAALAMENRVAVLAVAHCRKMSALDPFDEIRASTGLGGGADTLMVLRRERGHQDATLFVTGRDLDEQELALRWDGQYALWTALGDAAEVRLNNERAEVVQLLGKSTVALSPAEVADALGKNHGTIRGLLCRMHQDGQLTKLASGKYTRAHSANGAHAPPSADPDAGFKSLP